MYGVYTGTVPPVGSTRSPLSPAHSWGERAAHHLRRLATRLDGEPSLTAAEFNATVREAVQRRVAELLHDSYEPSTWSTLHNYPGWHIFLDRGALREYWVSPGHESRRRTTRP